MGLTEQIENRKRKIQQLREKKIEPYQYRCAVSATPELIKQDYSAYEGKEVSVAGRVLAVRKHGKTIFYTLKGEEDSVQIYLKYDLLGKERFELSELIDIGDFIGVQGEVFTTRTGEITISAIDLTILSKALRPLPEKWHGLRDLETRTRQRYLDLIVNPKTKTVFKTRRAIVDTVRAFLNARNYVEVETPVLQPIYGGAAARPFCTYHNVLDKQLFLRIADELYLKRLIIGGFQKVYEICKDFRNEGIDRHHNPEFTLLEGYEAYSDYMDIMELIEQLFDELALQIKEARTFEYLAQKIDFARPWRRVSYVEALEAKLGKDPTALSLNEMRDQARGFSLTVSEEVGKGKLLDALFSQLVQPELVQPTIVYDYPVEISPLAKRKRDDPRLAERFEPFVCGMELGNAFSELNDPSEQRRRFEDQIRQTRSDNEESHPLDEDFLTAMEYGMPPTGGFGIGIDRVTMIFTNSPSIRDVILFPLLR